MTDNISCFFFFLQNREEDCYRKLNIRKKADKISEKWKTEYIFISVLLLNLIAEEKEKARCEM